MASLGLQEEIKVGDEVVLSSDSPAAANYSVVFEDDGRVGYLYAIDSSDENHIIDAMHIYNVSSVIDREQPSTVQIMWSDDGLKAALLINDYPHAIFDFANNRGFCRNNFPSPSPNWNGHEWSDQAFESF